MRFEKEDTVQSKISESLAVLKKQLKLLSIECRNNFIWACTLNEMNSELIYDKEAAEEIIQSFNALYYSDAQDVFAVFSKPGAIILPTKLRGLVNSINSEKVLIRELFSSVRGKKKPDPQCVKMPPDLLPYGKVVLFNIKETRLHRRQLYRLIPELPKDTTKVRFSERICRPSHLIHSDKILDKLEINKENGVKGSEIDISRVKKALAHSNFYILDAPYKQTICNVWRNSEHKNENSSGGMPFVFFSDDLLQNIDIEWAVKSPRSLRKSNTRISLKPYLSSLKIHIGSPKKKKSQALRKKVNGGLLDKSDVNSTAN